MTVMELLEVAKVAAEAKSAAMKTLAKSVIAMLDRPPPPNVWLPTTDARSVHVPREANRYYTPSEARVLAVAILRAADSAEAYVAKRLDRVDQVPRR